MKKRLIFLAVIIAALLAAKGIIARNYDVSSVSADGHWQIANYANITDPKNTWDGVIYYYGSDAPHSITWNWSPAVGVPFKPRMTRQHGIPIHWKETLTNLAH